MSDGGDCEGEVRSSVSSNFLDKLRKVSVVPSIKFAMADAWVLIIFICA